MAGHNNHKFAPLLIAVGILPLKSEGGCSVPDKFNMLPQCRHKFSARQKQKHFPFELIRDENAAIHPLFLPHPYYSSLLPTIYAWRPLKMWTQIDSFSSKRSTALNIRVRWEFDGYIISMALSQCEWYTFLGRKKAPTKPWWIFQSTSLCQVWLCSKIIPSTSHKYAWGVISFEWTNIISSPPQI